MGVRMTVAAAAVLAAGGTAAAGTAPTGFDRIAAAGETVTLRVPTWMDGTVRVGGATGSVARRALGRSGATDSFGASVERVARYGGMRFAVTGAEVGGALSGDCTYHRAERRAIAGALTVSQPTAPLRMTCSFATGGAAVGTMTLAADPGAEVAARVGRIEWGDAVLDVRSLHRLGARGIRTDAPVGYAISAGGRDVAAVDLNGVTRRRLARPRAAGAERDAATAAGIALALLWDPGDTDD